MEDAIKQFTNDKNYSKIYSGDNLQKLIILLIRLYQKLPFSSHSFCRFYPTCSEYSIEAINKYGLKKGLKLGIKRIRRCHIGGKYGYDPIPEEGK